MTQYRDYPGLVNLAGKGFVVLGTGDGIGCQVAHALAQAGAALLCVDLSKSAANRTAKAVGGTAMVADITRRQDMQAVFAKAEELFGENFHGVVDVVGVPLPGALDQTDDASYDRQFDLVLRHAWLAISIAGPMLARRGRGSMVFIGSLGGLQYFPGVALYCTAKAALSALVRAASAEFGPAGVRVNVIAPGRIKASGMLRPQEDEWPRIVAPVPLRRAGEPSEVAGAALFLASDLSSYVTGETLLVDGGVHGVTPFPAP